jgi:uncharacterized repeat protein (TIGR01451 family)
MIRKLVARANCIRLRDLNRAQGLVEFGLILPLVLLLVLGVIEAGRMLAIYSGISSGAKQAARYGGVAGEVESGVPFYMDCTGMRNQVQFASVLQGLSPSDITIRYERFESPNSANSVELGWCPPLSATPSLSETIQNGDRVVISVTTTYRPIVPIVPLPPMPMTFAAARTIFTTIVGSTPTPRPDPDLKIAKIGFPPNAPPDGLLTYHIRVTNPQTSTMAHGVVVTDTLPSVLILHPTDPLPDECTVVVASPPIQIRCARAAPIAPNQTVTFTIRTKTPIFGNELITNTTGVVSNRPDLNASDNFTFTVNSILPGSDLQMHKAGPELVGGGARVTYTLEVENRGGFNVSTGTGSNYRPIRVTDTLPIGVVHIQTIASTDYWDCGAPAGVPMRIVCNVKAGKTLIVGERTPPILIVVNAPTVVGMTSIENHARMSFATGDLDPITHNDQMTVSTAVDGHADVQVNKLGTSSVIDGGVINYVVNVINNGPSVVTGGQLVDTLPAGTTYINHSVTAGWSCNYDAGVHQVLCGQNAGTIMQPGTRMTATLQVAAPLANVTLVNTATAFADQPEPAGKEGNNTDQAQTQVSLCMAQQADPNTSSLSAAPTEVQADQEGAEAIVTVTLRDMCGNRPTTSQNVTLSSSRPLVDTITVASPYDPNTGQISFAVRSSEPGVSTYSATANGIALNSTANVTFYGCPVGFPGSLSSDAQTSLPFVFSNGNTSPRRLLSLTINWPQGAGRQFLSLSRDGTNTTIWNGLVSTSPLSIPGGGHDWTGPESARTLDPGAAGQVFSFHFNFSVGNSGQFSIDTTWDNGSGGQTCVAKTVISQP